MDQDAVRRLQEVIARHHAFVHVTHVNPDADGFGSALAFSRYLRGLGKTSVVALPAAPPHRLSFLHAPDEIEVIGEGEEGRLPDGAVYMLYDISTLDRLGRLEPVVAAATTPLVVFDHHDGEPERDGLCFVDEAAGATAQVMHDVLAALGAELSLDLAVPLYVGLVSDTGSFNYGKTSPHTHEIAARLLEAGVRPLEIHGALAGSRSLAAVQVAGRVMARMEHDRVDPRIAHATLDHASWLEGGSEPLDTVDLVNQTISLEGVLAGVLFIHVEERTTRLSLRSKGDVSIIDVARAHGGGGHRNAAGATLNAPPEAVREAVLESLRRALREQVDAPPAAAAPRAGRA